MSVIPMMINTIATKTKKKEDAKKLAVMGFCHPDVLTFKIRNTTHTAEAIKLPPAKYNAER